MMNAQVLRQFPLFCHLPQEEIDQLDQTLEEFRFQPGEVVFREGTVSGRFYVVLDGQVEIVKSLGTPDERVLAVNQRGAMLGEMSMFSRDGSHTASARARSLLTLYKISFEQFDDILRRHPELAYTLLRLYSSRLEESESQTIQDLREKNARLTLAYQELQAAQAAMIEKEKLERELQIASNLQCSILPTRLPSAPGLDFGALMMPARQVGGDFYDFIQLDERRVGIVVGDVCDKGIPSALFMALTYSFVRSEAARQARPADLLQAVNQQLLQVNRSRMFVTLLYGVLDCQTGELVYARAGHPPLILLDRAHRPVELPNQSGQPLGMFWHPRIDEGSTRLPPGGTLLVYSDGLSETLDARETGEALPDLCAQLLDAAPDLAAQRLCERLWEQLGGETSESEVKDDFTVAVVRSQLT